MSFTDIFKKSFLEGYAGIELKPMTIAIVLGMTSILAIYIFFCYRILTRKTFYSRNFNISLVAIALITAAIILTIQSSIVISLGMVGALSIVRFRTAIKDPMDLVFLFWSIGVGIICGAGLVEIALVLSLVLTVFVILLNKIPMARAPKILVINISDDDGIYDKIVQIIKKNTRTYDEKTRKITGEKMQSIVYEIRIRDGSRLIDELKVLPGLKTVSLLSHDGEVTF